MTTYSSGRPEGPVLLFAPGAGAGENHAWMQRTAKGMAGRGVTTTTFDFPYRKAGKRLPDKGPVLEAAYREVWLEVARQHPAGTRLYLGGKSMGGRIATQVAATGGLDPAPAGVVCVGFPLHPPGRAAQRRDRHLPALQAPILFVHGTRDPFGSPDEMRELAGWLPRATLVLVDGGDHSLVTTKRQDPDGSFEAALDRMAGWILASSAGRRDTLS